MASFPKALGSGGLCTVASLAASSWRKAPAGAEPVGHAVPGKGRDAAAASSRFGLGKAEPGGPLLTGCHLWASHDRWEDRDGQLLLPFFSFCQPKGRKVIFPKQGQISLSLKHFFGAGEAPRGPPFLSSPTLQSRVCIEQPFYMAGRNGIRKFSP